MIDALHGRTVVAVIRRTAYRDVAPLVRCLLAGGISALEFTYTGDGAVQAAVDAKQFSADVVAGVGSVRSLEELEQSIAAGLDFAVSPALDEELIRSALGRIPFLPGVLTPSEVMRAQRLGCSVVKLFPASLGGPSYLGDIAMLFPGVQIMPSGGVRLAEVPAYLAAGASAVSLGTDLVGSARQPRDTEHVTELARGVCSAITAWAASERSPGTAAGALAIPPDPIPGEK
jgi:2-dehydro-3-deoxyphosphogluconate aldolase/(4S)-4-hydroxy-2-oxoglutarate aldolase